MSTGDTTESERAAIERRRREFEAYAERFAADVRNKREAMEAAGGAFEEYAAAFAADVAERRDVTDRLVAIDAFHEEIQAVRLAFEQYAAAFDDDSAAFAAAVDELDEEFAATAAAFEEYAATAAEETEQRLDPSAFLDAVEATAAVMREKREELAAAAASMAEDREDLAAGSEELAAEFRTAGEAFLDYAAEFHGIDDPAALGQPPVDEGVETDEARPITAAVDGTPARADLAPPSVERSDSFPERPDDADLGVGADASGNDDDRADTGEDDGDGAGTGDEPSVDADETDEADAFESELREIQYGKLKRAANEIGYPDNLNEATKDDLVGFLADHRDELQEALGTDA